MATITDSPASSTDPQSSPPLAQTSPVVSSPSKITLLLKAVGDAPQLKNPKVNAEGSRPVSYVISYLQKALKLDPSESIYIFVSQSFSPSPDHTLSNLYECFAASPSSNLVLHYAKTCAWG